LIPIKDSNNLPNTTNLNTTNLLTKLIETNWSRLYIHYLVGLFTVPYIDAKGYLTKYVGKRLDSYRSVHSDTDVAIYEAIKHEEHLILFEIITRGYMDCRRSLAKDMQRERDEQDKARQLSDTTDATVATNPINRNTAKQLQIDPNALSDYLDQYVRNADTRHFIYSCLTAGVKWTQDQYDLTNRQLTWKMHGIEQQFKGKDIKQVDVDMVTNYQEHHDTEIVSQLAMAVQFNNYEALHSILKANWDSDVCCDAMDVDEPIRMFKLLGVENIHSTYQMVDNIDELMNTHALLWDSIKIGSDEQ